MGLIEQIGQWFDRRLQLAAPIREAAEHPVPRNTASWFYVFGSAALTVFLLQLVTGILLALIYGRSAGSSAPCMDGARTSWWRLSSFTWCRSSCSGPTSSRVNLRGSSAFSSC